MLEKLFNKVEENYAVKAMKKIETKAFETKEEAEQAYNVMLFMFHDDLDGIDIKADYYQEPYITISGPETGKRGLHWCVSLDMRKYVRV